MTTEDTSDNDIDTLALRAKEMLERVRGSADPGTSSAAASPTLERLSSNPITLDKASESEAEPADEPEDPASDDAVPAGMDTETPDEIDPADPEMAESESVEIEEDPEVESDEVEASDIETTEGIVETESVDSDDSLEVDTETPVDADAEVSTEADTLDPSAIPDVPPPIPEELLAEDVDDDAELGSDPADLDDHITGDADADLDDSATEATTEDEENWPEFSFASKAKEDAESTENAESPEDAESPVEEIDTDVEASEVDIEEIEAEFAEDTVIDAEIIDDAELEFDAQTAELEVDEGVVDETINVEPFDDEESFQGVFDGEEDIPFDESAEGIGYLGDDNNFGDDTPTIDTDDLVSEIGSLSPYDETIDLELDLDETTEGASTEGVGVIEGGAVVAGAAAAAAMAVDNDGDPMADEIRSRGRLKDLSPDEEAGASAPKGSFSSGRKPHVDQDLNELFVNPGTSTSSSDGSSYWWVAPLILVALTGIGLIIWSSTRGGEDDGVDTSAADVVDDVTTSEPADDPETTTTTTTAPTTTVVDTDTAWGLVGASSNTDDLVALGAPLGLEQVLRQEVDSDENPVSFTFLAPSNEAFAKLSDEERAELVNNPNVARDILAYHFIDQPLTPELIARGEIVTRSGEEVVVTMVGDEILFNGVGRIERDDLDASNGSILVIDTILRPDQAVSPTTTPAEDAEATTTTTAAPSGELSDVVDLANVQFQVLSSRITPEGQAELQNAVTFFQDNPNATAVIEGHTDSDGVAEKNQTLSQQRADAVRQFLVSNGIDGSRLEAVGFGDTQPILVNGVEDKAASRRIEISVSE